MSYCDAVDTAHIIEKLGPTGLLAGVRPTPLNTLEGTSMPTFDSIVHVVRDLQLGLALSADKYRIGELTRDEFVGDVNSAHDRHDERLAALPVPACPDWCDQPAGHPYETATEGECGDAYAARWHKRVFYDSPKFEVFVEAEEQLVATGLSGRTVVEAMVVSTIGNLDQVSADEARKVARALDYAADLASGPDESTQGND